MKRFKTIALAGLFFVTNTITAYAAPSSDFVNALSKTQAIKSCETTSNFKINFDVKGLSDEEKSSMEMAKNLINNIQFKVDAKTNKSEDNLKTKTYCSLKTTGSFATSTELWVDADLSGKTPKFNEIIKVPKELAMFLPPEVSGKEYFVLNSDKLIANDPKASQMSQLDIKALMESQNKYIELLSKYGQEIFNNPNIFSDLGEQASTTSDNLHKYKLSLDDKALKECINKIALNMLSSEDGIKMLKSFMPKDATEKSAKDELDNFKKTMNDLKTKTLLGKRGLVLNYYVNKEGYISQVDGYIDFEINLADFDKTGANFNKIEKQEKTKSLNSIISLSLDFDAKYTNINGDIKIEMPVINAKNSTNLADLMKSAEPSKVPATKIPAKKVEPKKVPAKKVTVKKVKPKKVVAKKVVAKKAPIKKAPVKAKTTKK